MHLVTPCRNAAGTISETIESVIAQAALSPIRYHVQDGLTTDGVQSILADYQERIRSDRARYGHVLFSWASEADTGMYDAIARAVDGMDVPPDSFMGWINADDLLCPGAVRAVQEIERNLPDVAWIGGPALVMDMDGKVRARGRLASQYPQALLAHGLCDGLHWKFLQQEGMFWRKRLWDAAGGLDPRFRLAGDWDLWRRMARHAEYAQLPTPTGIFRKRQGQLSAGHGYDEELDSILPKEKRRSALRRLLPDLPRMRTVNLKRNHDGALTRHMEPLRLGWKDLVRLFLATFGLYRLLRRALLCASASRSLFAGQSKLK
ncbi:MAG: glycosyl transferase family 2 [Deltaproteobacteria bacterium]|jgi:hypothetical protein|nr:glycosyl transferase family 2 [Deltaproteobacteria bacterium]